jgi:hypothetical protein
MYPLAAMGQANIADAARLAKVYDVWTAGLMELGRVAQAVDHERWQAAGIMRNIISLEILASTYLDKPIRKGKVWCTNWGKSELENYQKICIHQRVQLIVDAANDCYASWKIFQVLDIMRHCSSDPTLEIPSPVDYQEFWDEKVKDDLKKKKRTLVKLGRQLVNEGAICISYIEEIDKLISVRMESSQSQVYDI